MRPDYQKVINQWEQMTEQEQIEALQKARIWHKGMKLSNISYYTKRIALQALKDKLEF